MHPNSLFYNSDRLKLTISIMEAEQRVGGAGIGASLGAALVFRVSSTSSITSSAGGRGCERVEGRRRITFDLLFDSSLMAVGSIIFSKR